MKKVVKTIRITMPIELYSALDWLSKQKDSKGQNHSISEIMISATNLYLLTMQEKANAINEKN